ncbi:hypothetical protein LAG90_17395 [Marinilongibacter aquaticus]|uniref:hypothetical protein n=1 Tax=Marinilongibacter aquaticus TaxID=2975157 RepID=UPI0021BDBDD8|nr:hypothetical protein [Marinilongibacter aquaticus]UBM58580.1 hypothetical protein LAG90_17395 [Marinilongibacter aquaticus]
MSEKGKNIGYYLLVILLIGASFWGIYVNGVNVPHWDDHAIRHFVNEKNWGQFFSFHNEHRIAFTRLVAFLVNLIFGNLNFKIMMYVGQIALVGVMAWFIYLQKKLNLIYIGLLAMACFIFNYSTFENSLWAMAAVQNHWIIFWSLSSLLCLLHYGLHNSEKKPFFIAAMLCSLMALLTSGNGVLVAPIGFLNLLILGKRKDWLIWAGGHLLVFALYFWGFESTASRPNIEDFFFNLIALMGSAFYPLFGMNLPIKMPMLMGLAVLVFSAFVLLRLLFEKGNNPKLMTYLTLSAFFIGTMILVALSRSEYDRMVLLSSKYKIYSFLQFGTALTFGFSNRQMEKNKYYFPVLLGILLLFFNAQFSYADEMKLTRAERIADTFNLKSENQAYVSYQLPEFPFESEVDSARAILDENKVDSIAIDGDAYLFFEKDLNPHTDNFVFLKSRTHSTLVPMVQKGPLFSSKKHGEARLLLYNFPTDIYQVFYLETEKGKSKFYNTNKTLRIEGVQYTEKPKNW